MDLALMQCCHKYPEVLDQLGGFFLGCIAEPRHNIIFKRTSPESLAFDWHVGIRVLGDSSVLAWPIVLVAVPNAPGKFAATLQPDVAHPCLLTITTWTGIVGCHYEWRSWASQCELYPEMAKMWFPALRMIVEGASTDLHVLAAEKAWWAMGVTLLTKIAQHLMVELPANARLFQVLLALTRHALECSEARALELLALRMRKLDDYASTMQELMQVDEAAKCLTVQDEKEFNDTKKDVAATRQELQDFENEFAERRRAVRMAAAKAAPKTKAKGKPPQAKGKPTELPKKVSEIPQAEAKLFMPDDGRLWKNNTDGAWVSRVPPLSPFSRSWAKYGEELSLRKVITNAWKQHCVVNGVALAECPMKGLDWSILDED